MRMLDLFSGIGGFAYAAKEVFGTDLEMVGFCDIDEYCFKVLEKNFPGVPIFNDVQKLTGESLGRVDMICGGFPCQDISTAGKGLGIEKGKRSGLWSEFHRLIGELRPRFSIIENVSALTSRGLNIVLRDLAEIGYDAEWQCIGAYEVGARHKRDRIWIVAYPNSEMLQRLNKQEDKCTKNGKEKQISRCSGDGLPIPNSSSLRPCREKTNRELEWERPSICDIKDRDRWGEGSLLESRLGGMVYGIPNWIYETWREEPKGIPRQSKSTNKDKRKERMIALGNSIVPQIPMLIMRRIKELTEQE
jgi:DNA (cytosine-5)-methyltransferase 1